MLTTWCFRIALVDIEEPCKHEIQFGGLCTNCGRDMTEYGDAADIFRGTELTLSRVDFMTTQRNADRATVTMSHDNTALKVSQSEAARASEEAKRRLLESRKLSLVVDLDQTIIHATVDPTVAEWQRDPANPNYEAVKNVRSFQLIDDGPGGRGCWYYIKLRPGLEEFLEEISKTYELHIYTMGTRAYAQNIAKLVDPQQKIFGDRILSRDESGSMVVKNLQRLFPVDTDMVVIIDDRGDVWKWSENLIKVIPYDFFVGIGDINSSFLPKRADLVSRRKPPPAKLTLETAPEAVAGAVTTDKIMEEAKDPEEPVNESTPEVIDNAIPVPISDAATLGIQLVAMAGGDDPSVLEEQSNAQTAAIEAQIEDRPLLQKQKMLDERDENEENKELNGEEGGDTASEHEHKHRHNLLHDDDEELRYLQKHLESVHSTFFEEYDEKLRGGAPLGRVSQLRGEKSPKKARPLPDDSSIVPDVKDIMPYMKAQVLQGVVICFTGVIPQGINHES
jgi:RNA polymerase II subunit A-like phosphatase